MEIVDIVSDKNLESGGSTSRFFISYHHFAGAHCGGYTATAGERTLPQVAGIKRTGISYHAISEGRRCLSI